MKSLRIIFAASLIALAGAPQAHAQLNLNRLGQGLLKGIQAVTLTDAQMAAYVHESVEYMDKENQVAPPDSPYTVRLNRLVDGITDVNGIPLNFKVYLTSDVNAFACADGSVRVFSAIMDMMNDDELLGIIGHEIGHVGLHHSKNAFKQELLNGALKDAVASTSDKVAALTDSQLAKIADSFVNAKYSRKQENEADDYGYDFLRANGKNPWGMVDAFTKMKVLEEQGGASAQSSYITKMFSSHPETVARIEHMTQRCNADGIARPVVQQTTTKSTSKTSTKKTTKKKSTKSSKSTKSTKK